MSIQFDKIKPFPKHESVFKDSNNELKLIFTPLCSLNIGLIDSSIDEWVHFIEIWDNGDYEENNFNDNRGENWIKFKLNKGKYLYNGSLNAFPKHNMLKQWHDESLNEYKVNQLDYTSKKTPEEYLVSLKKTNDDKRMSIDFDYFLYLEQQLSYLITKDNYFKTSKFFTSKYYTDGYLVPDGFQGNDFLNKIGSDPEWIHSDETPIDKNGHKLSFIGQLTAWKYLDNGADEIFLFYDKIEKEVVQIFQYS